jgi:hypothetical protein
MLVVVGVRVCLDLDKAGCWSLGCSLHGRLVGRRSCDRRRWCPGVLEARQGLRAAAGWWGREEILRELALLYSI